MAPRGYTAINPMDNRSDFLPLRSLIYYGMWKRYLVPLLWGISPTPHLKMAPLAHCMSHSPHLIHHGDAIGPFLTSPINTAIVGRIGRILVALDFCYSLRYGVFAHIKFGNPERSRGVPISSSFLDFATSYTNVPK